MRLCCAARQLSGTSCAAHSSARETRESRGGSYKVADLEQQLRLSRVKEAQTAEQMSRARERARKVEGQAQLSAARLAKSTAAHAHLLGNKSLA